MVGLGSVFYGAGNEVRTRDLLLGKQMYYQLYYTRIILSLKASNYRRDCRTKLVCLRSPNPFEKVYPVLAVILIPLFRDLLQV